MNWWEVEINGVGDAVRILREARKFLHDSARSLARALSVHEVTIWRWERGKSLPRLTPSQGEFLINYVRSAQGKKRLSIEYRALKHARIRHVYQT